LIKALQEEQLSEKQQYVEDAAKDNQKDEKTEIILGKNFMTVTEP